VTISGNITSPASGPLAGVAINISGAATATSVTDQSGHYSVAMPTGSFVVTPSMAGYIFTPTSKAVSGQNSNQPTNFTTILASPTPPSLVSLTPSSGTGASQAFTAIFSDPNGAGDISGVNFLVQQSSNGTGAHSCIVRLDLTTNALSLLVDAAGSWLGPIQLGSNATLANSQCLLNGASSSVQINGNSLSATFNLAFKAATFNGTQQLYAQAIGSPGSSTFGVNGSWTIPATTTVVPSFVSLTPSSGTGAGQAFTAVFSDPNGAGDISTVDFLIQQSTNATGASSCIVRLDMTTNSLLLLVDAAGSYLPPIQLGGNASLSNSQCILHGATSSARINGNTLSATFDLVFRSTFNGLQQLYTQATNSAGTSPFGISGNWTVSASPIPAGYSVKDYVYMNGQVLAIENR
jgi:hypothetical protein